MGRYDTVTMGNDIETLYRRHTTLFKWGRIIERKGLKENDKIT